MERGENSNLRSLARGEKGFVTGHVPFLCTTKSLTRGVSLPMMQCLGAILFGKTSEKSQTRRAN